MNPTTFAPQKTLPDLSPWEFTQRLKANPYILQEAAKLLNAPAKITYKEFLDWADEDTLAEWVNGDVIMTSPASRKHQLIGDFLNRIIAVFVEEKQLGLVISPPFQMKLSYSGREPDLIFVAQKHLERLQETCLNGPADMVIEIISPESQQRDRGDKFYEYETGGVPEYWLLDPIRQLAEIYALNQEGVYNPVFTGKEGIYYSRTIKGFWLQIEWLWQEPLPTVLDTLRRLELI